MVQKWKEEGKKGVRKKDEKEVGRGKVRDGKRRVKKKDEIGVHGVIESSVLK